MARRKKLAKRSAVSSSRGRPSVDLVAELADPNIVTAARLAGVLGGSTPFTDRWLRELADRGYLVKAGRACYDLAGSVQGYIRFVRETEVKPASSTEARTDFDFERARKLKLENDEREAKLIDIDLAIGAVDLIVGMMRTDLAGVPARITEDVELRRRAEDAIDTVLKGLAGRFAKAGADLRAGRDPSDADETDNA